MSNPGSSSSHGIAHLGRPFDAGKARLDRGEADTAVDAAHRHVFGQDVVEQRPILRRAEDPAAGGENEGRLDIPGRLDRRLQIVDRALDLPIFGIAPRPRFRRPEPVVVERVSLRDPLEHAFVQLAHDGRIAGVLAHGS